MWLKIAWLLILVFDFVTSSTRCGVPAKGISLIIRGQSFRRGAWPWMVALLEKSETGNEFFCSGVLISRNKVLTAAHCIHGKYQQARKVRDIALLLGAYDLSDSHEEGAYLTSPSEIVIHPDWVPNSLRYDADIAAINLDEEVPNTKFIKPICIGKMNFNTGEGFVTGWGKSEDRSKIHENIPKEVKVPIWSNEHCMLETPEFAHLSSRRTFCAGWRNNSGPCNGDSGGGLYVKEPGGAYHLKGIVSASLADDDGICDSTSFVLYTNIDKFTEWIDGELANASVTRTSGPDICYNKISLNDYQKHGIQYISFNASRAMVVFDNQTSTVASIPNSCKTN